MFFMGTVVVRKVFNLTKKVLCTAEWILYTVVNFF